MNQIVEWLGNYFVQVLKKQWKWRKLKFWLSNTTTETKKMSPKKEEFIGKIKNTWTLGISGILKGGDGRDP